MLYNIWIDDMRKPPHKDNLVYFINAEDAIKWFEAEEELRPGDVLHLWLDHDLGEGKSGYDFCKWFIEWNLDKQYQMSFSLLTANPVGAENMYQLLTHYGYTYCKLTLRQ